MNNKPISKGVFALAVVLVIVVSAVISGVVKLSPIGSGHGRPFVEMQLKN